MWNVIRLLIAATVLAAVTQISQRYPRAGALVLTFPLISVLAFILSWQQNHDIAAISRFAKETLILVPLGLPFFVPLAFADRLGLGFWSALGVGFVLASIGIGLWFAFGPKEF